MLREPRLLHAQAENHKGMKNLSTIIVKKQRKIGLSFPDILVSQRVLFEGFRLEMPHEWLEGQLTYAVGLDREEEKKIGTVP